jgi:hypothetical protein
MGVAVSELGADGDRLLKESYRVGLLFAGPSVPGAAETSAGSLESPLQVEEGRKSGLISTVDIRT